MTWPFAVFTFINAWWIMLFIALPFGIEHGEKTGVEYQAAPKHIRWKRILLLDTALALLVTLALALVIQSGLIDVR